MFIAGTDSPVTTIPVSICDLVRLWKTDMTVEEIAQELDVSPAEIRAIAKKRKLKPKKKTDVEPTPEEILERAAEIRANWSDTERQQRMVVKHVPAGFYAYRYDSYTGIFTSDGYARKES